MGARAKLTDRDVKRIRARLRRGAYQTQLADEFGVNRKTIRRRLDALEQAEAERAERIAEKRLWRQAAREKERLFQRERDAGVFTPTQVRGGNGLSAQPTRITNAYVEWLDRRKNLAGAALSEASGLVRIQLPDGSIRRWVEREGVEAFLDQGWILDELS